MKCGVDGCDNQAFQDLDECALHCDKDCVHEDSINDVLSEFNRLLNFYILDDVLSRYIPDSEDESYTNEIVTYRKNNKCLYDSIIFKEKFSEYKIRFYGILFPNILFINYTDTLRIFKNIWFEKCVFYVDYFNLKSTGVFFEECVFKYDFCIKPTALFLLKTDSVFYRCIFDHKIYIGSKGKDREVFEYGLFEECNFKGVISLNNAEFQRELFKFKPTLNIDSEASERTYLSSMLINNIVFHDKCKFNYIDIVNLIIKDTKFLSKLEVQDSIVSCFEFNNSNVSKIFDAFNSQFIRFLSYKSIFIDFSGFEKVSFGSKGSVNDLYIARFVYTTFMSFSNFRGTKFLSGLDFENSNLKEQPNFLKTDISSENTNRETFRIVKYSFDARGNTLEANRFFVQEMKAFKNELKEEGDFWNKLVYNVNDLISEFGRNYIRAIIWLIISLILYTILLYLHDWYFDNFDYFIWGKLEWIWIFLNDIAKNFLPFSRFLESKSGFEFISLFFYIWFGILIWQIIVAVKRHTQR